ncbi:MAG TPA: response regulator [Novosphingobium sp.]|nr:response regulator [Novosphingobium sp.]
MLVVDDVEGNRQLVCRRLAPCGYALHEAESGEEALAFLSDNRPELILLDYMMPNMSGIEVLRRLRQDSRLQAIPVIMLTARAESAAMVAALEAGADDYVTKPIDFDVLKARITTQLARHRDASALRAAQAAHDERTTMRVLAFDELHDELEREIAQRRQIEQSLASARGRLAECDACRADSPPATQAQSPQVARALEIIDAIGRALEAGKPVNPALLAALRMQVASLDPPAG